MFSNLSVRRLAGLSIALLLSALSAACKSEPKTASFNISGYNHTDTTIGAFYVNGKWGGALVPGVGGGKFVCCLKLPDPWQPGMKVTVEWDDKDDKQQTRLIEIPQYDAKTASTANVHFLRSGEIKIFVNRYSLWHTDYPLKGKEAELKPGVPIERWH